MNFIIDDLFEHQIQSQIPKKFHSTETYLTYFVVVMKNCEPLEFGPELAIDNDPKLPCFRIKFSSANFLP